jgi:hypothetical protein
MCNAEYPGEQVEEFKWDVSPDDFKWHLTKEQLRMIYVGMNIWALLNGILILNLRYIVSVFYVFLFVLFVIFSPTNINIQKYARVSYIALCGAQMIGWTGISYIQEYYSKLGYIAEMKVKRLTMEQRQILEQSPDGLIIHQNRRNTADVKYLNSTFTSMFMINQRQNTILEESKEATDNCSGKIT